MPNLSNVPKLKLLWKRLEEAKLQLDLCHNFMNEIRDDKAAGTVSVADGSYAHGRTLRIYTDLVVHGNLPG